MDRLPAECRKACSGSKAAAVHTHRLTAWHRRPKAKKTQLNPLAFNAIISLSMRKSLVIGLFLSIFLCFLANRALAESNYQIEFEEVNPSDRGEYFIKRVKEKFGLLIYSFTPQKKAGFYAELVDRRFSELVFTFEHKDDFNMEKASNRYFTSIGQAVEFVEDKDWPVKTSLKNALNKHEPILENMIKKTKYNSANWLFLSQNLDYLRGYRDRL